MAVDYDLVVIGASRSGVYAAALAAQRRARVALVTQNLPSSEAVSLLEGCILREVGAMLDNARRTASLGVAHPPELLPTATQWERMQRWLQVARATVDLAESPASLAASGVEVIAGSGEFYRKPHLGFSVGGRRLRSRAYLLATAHRSALPEIDGLEAAGYETIGRVLNHSPLLESSSVAIVGVDPRGVELAQALNRLGLQVTLIVPSPHLLPLMDGEAARLVQAQLEAEGVRVLTRTQVSQIRQIDGKKWLQAGDQAIETDVIFLATEPEPDVSGLNLEAAGIHWAAAGITANSKLQTTNPRVYVCTHPEDAISPHRAQQRAYAAVRNALFFPLARVADPVPVVSFTQPEIGQVGLTEALAADRYGKDLIILRQFLKTLPIATVPGTTGGFCKLMVRRSGQIVGASLVGESAGELLPLLTLLIQQKQTVQTLTRLGFSSGTASEILHLIGREWEQMRSAASSDWLEGWFNLRRSWSR